MFIYQILLITDYENFDIVVEDLDVPISDILLQTPKEIFEKALTFRNDVQLGLTINWGRSAIEGRNIDEPENHVAYASNCGVLSGVMFSGVASNEDSLYGAWRDLHAPPQKAFDIQHYEDSSLMSYDNIRNTMNSCEIKGIDYMGIKLLPLPSTLPISNRIGINKDAITLIRKALDQMTEKVRFNQ